MKILSIAAVKCWLSVIVMTHLFGCASRSMPMADVISAIVSGKLGASDELIQTTLPDPLYRYLRVEVEGHSPALLVLGYVDAHPQGDIEVWYSAKHEVIKTQNGRIVATTGLEIDWRAVRFPSPPPIFGLAGFKGETYQRLRDEMPDHRYAINDQIELKSWNGLPPINLPATLSSEKALTYNWFSEKTLSSSAQSLPPSWFAWGINRGQSTVVYSEQCLSATFCLKLQRWPVQEGAS